MFDRAVCLNLDKRFSNRERIKKQFGENGIAVDFFLAGDGKMVAEPYDHVDVTPPRRSGYPAWANRPNSYNAFLCFRKIIERAFNDNVRSLLLIEDDAIPTNQFSEVLALALKQLPEPWDMLYLGANHTFSRTHQVCGNLLRVNGSGCFHGVVLNCSIFMDILQLPMAGPIDGEVAKALHPIRQCYAVWPNIVVTEPGFSHCEGREVDYTDYFKEKGCP